MAKEYFPGIGKIKFEGKDSKNPLAYRYYDADKVIMGKKMSEWLKFAMAWWHTLCAEGSDQFGPGTKSFPWNGAACPVQAAKDKLAEYNLELDDSRISWELTDDIEKDLIVSSSPNAEEEVEKGAKIRVTVSLGTYSILKDYKGFNYRDAEEELKRLNFIVKRNPVASDDVEAGKIISQSMEPGTKYNPEINNEITLNYSQDTSFQIPLELLGKSIEDVIDYFNEEGIEFELQPQPVSEFTDEETKESKPNTLIRTDPELGSYYNQKDNIKVKIYYYEGD